MKRLTKKEEVIMNHFWEKGPLFVRELRELYPGKRAFVLDSSGDVGKVIVGAHAPGRRLHRP